MDIKASSEEDYRNKLEGLSWNDLRKEVKAAGIPAKGNRDVLTEKLLMYYLGTPNNKLDADLAELKDDVVDKIDEFVEQEFMEETDGDIDQKNVTCSSYIVDKVNATFTIAKCEDEMNDAEQLNISSETFTIEKSASELDMRRLSDARENFEGVEEMDQDDLLNNSNETYTVEEKENDLKTSVSDCGTNINTALSLESKADLSDEKKGRWFASSPQKRGDLTEHFAKIHTNLYNAMPTLEAERNKLQQRHMEHQASTSERIQRLATPKQVRSCTRLARADVNHNIFNPGSIPPPDPKTLNFNFGDVPVADIAKVQKPLMPSLSAGPSRIPIKKCRSSDLRVDVKKRTMNEAKAKSRQTQKVIPATIPEMTPRLEILATPRRLAPNNGRVSTPFKPYTGKFEFVDTTKMTDREFEAYQARSKTPRK